MTNEPPLSGVSDVVGAQVRRWRDWHGWTIDELAAQCAEIGAPHLTTASLYALESGRRADGRRRRLVSVDELLTLAQVLKVKPDELLVPPEFGDRDPYPLTPDFITTAGAARAWLRGEGKLGHWAAVGPNVNELLGDLTQEALLRFVIEKGGGDPVAKGLLKALNQMKGGEDAGDPQDRPE